MDNMNTRNSPVIRIFMLYMVMPMAAAEAVPAEAEVEMSLV